MWPTFKTEHPFDPPVFTKLDVSLVSLVWGFTLGFGYFVVLHAVRLTRRVKRFSIFIMLIWLELVGSFIYGIVSILYVNSAIPSSFWIYFWILIAWILQLQCLVQIIVNRIGLLMYDPRHRRWLKISMLVWIGLINLGVAIIWIPAQLQINSTYIRINHIFDRLEKCLYLVTDAALNWFFIRTVRRHLVAAGLRKYDALVRYNMMIIWVSLAMDALIIGAMSLKNQFLYTIFHPLAYTVKLEIEMTMSNLIVQVALHAGIQIDEFGTASTDLSRRLDSPIFRTTVHNEAAVENITLPPIISDDSEGSDGQKTSRLRLKNVASTSSFQGRGADIQSESDMV
ncbi:hypothetical protein VKT23_005271 [Stygiomarasmius scandens]|uniref:Integral membrane protein n=1 Tax=Marasmiellus scandens TaxID=2682957 RepID=A0ABR1JSJ9_9AGAR